MIRIRDISLPPEHLVEQLSFEAAKLLKISSSKIRQLRIVRRSLDAINNPINLREAFEHSPLHCHTDHCFYM